MEDRLTPANPTIFVDNPLNVVVANQTNLWQAITKANGDAGADTIEIKQAALQGASEYRLTDQLPVITDGIEIKPDAGVVGSITVKRISTTKFRIFTIDMLVGHGANGVKFENIDVTNGWTGGLIDDRPGATGPDGSNGACGGGIWSRNASVQMANCKVYGNVADVNGGGVWATGDGQFFHMIAGSALTANRAWLNGGGAYAYNTYLALKGSSATGNTASHNGGGIAAVGQNYQAARLVEVIAGSSVGTNTALGGDGGGISVINMGGPQALQVDLKDSTLNGNKVYAWTDSGGTHHPGRGGGLSVIGRADVSANAQTVISNNGAEMPFGTAPTLCGVYLDPTLGFITGNFLADVRNDNYVLPPSSGD